MARVLVCDRCGTPKGVQSQVNLSVDLCHDCALNLLGEFVSKELIAERRATWSEKWEPAFGVDLTDRRETVPPEGATVLTNEALIIQRRATLFARHAATIYDIVLKKPVTEFPHTTKYGPPGEEDTVQVLEAIPGKPGHYFAKVIQ